MKKANGKAKVVVLGVCYAENLKEVPHKAKNKGKVIGKCYAESLK